MSRSRLLSLFLLGGLLLGSAGSASGAPMPKEALERVRQLAVQHGGRLKPLDSFSWEVLDRLTGEPRWRNQHPVDTVLSIAADPGRWQKEPLIAVPFVPLREALGLNRKTSHVSYSQLAEEKTLVQMLPGIAAKQRQNEKLTMLENEAMDAYDRFALLTALFTQELHLVPPLGEEKIWLPILAPAGYSPEKRQALQSAWKGFLAVLLAAAPGDPLQRLGPVSDSPCRLCAGCRSSVDFCSGPDASLAEKRRGRPPLGGPSDPRGRDRDPGGVGRPASGFQFL
jgi:hypothetical protein